MIRKKIPGPNAKKMMKREAVYFSPSFDRLYPLFSKSVRGSIIEDVDGNKFIDFSAGSGSQPLGGSPPELVQLIKDKVQDLGHIAFPYINEATIDLSEKLCKIAPIKGDLKVSYGTSGAEAVEGAFKLARWYTRRQLCISFLGAHSGHETMGGLSLSGHYAGQKAGFHPTVPGIIHVPYAYCYRCHYRLTYPDCNLRCFYAIEEDIFTTIAPPEDIAAMLVEPLLGPGGMVMPPPEFQRSLKKLCEQYGILYLSDEIVTGLGRTGKMFAIEHFGIEPDITILGKGLGGGVFPISAFIAKSDVMSWPPGVHSATYPAHPLGCAIALKTIELLEEKNIPQRVARLGKYLLKRCKEIQDRHKLIGDVRVKGLFGGVELVKNRGTKKPAAEEVSLVAYRAFEKGLALQYDGLKFNVFKLYPPLTIKKEELETALTIFEDSLFDVEKGRVSIPGLPRAYLVQTMYK